MPYAFTQDVPITWPVYEQIRRELGEAVPRGLIAHLVIETEKGLRYLDVWESKEQCMEFLSGRIHPILGRIMARAGIARPEREPSQDPIEVREVWAPRQLLDGRVK
jgi:hypothetical protein